MVAKFLKNQTLQTLKVAHTLKLECTELKGLAARLEKLNSSLPALVKTTAPAWFSALLMRW